MLHIPDHATIIAPVHLHLPLYQTILKQKKNCIGIRVISLYSFIQNFLPESTVSDSVLLYKYREALQDLSSSNAFYHSRGDVHFLRECLQFMKEAKLYDIQAFPKDHKKEQSLHEIIMKLWSVELIEDHVKDIRFGHLDRIYILQQEYPVSAFYWIRRLLDQGAHWLQSDTKPNKKYYSVSNARKQAQLVAETIIKHNYDANDISIALNEPKDRWVIEQMLTAYHIPFTALSDPQHSNIPDQWAAALRWLQYHDRAHFASLIDALYPEDRYINDFLTLFPDGKIIDPVYQTNAFIDESTWSLYQKWQNQYDTWIHEQDLEWTVEDIAKIIQEKNAPTQINRSIFSRIQQLIADCIRYIHSSEDWDILIHEIESISADTKADSIQGVLIGHRKDITPIRPVVFFIGVHGKVFPALSQETGIFNESYREKTDLPALSERLQMQRKILYQTLNSPDDLYVIYPQADYNAKTNDPSVEMNEWMHTKDTYIDIETMNVWIKPDFTLSSQTSNDLFFKGNQFHASASRLESFASCPLKHFLQYGLRLRAPKDWTDIRIRGTLLHHILEKAANDHGKTYADRSQSEIRQYIDKEFAWLEMEFPHKKKWIQTQKDELETKLILLFEQLSAFESKWHMNSVHQEKKLRMDLDWDGITISLTGYIDRIDESSTSFCIFDYKSGKRTLKMDAFEAGLSLQLVTYTLAYEKESKRIPVGAFYIILKSEPEKQVAMELKARKTDNVVLTEESEYVQAYNQAFKPAGWSFQDLSIYYDNAKKKPVPQQVFTDLKEKWPKIITSIVSEIHEGSIRPEHDPQACQWCHYRRICRNARVQEKKTSRAEVHQ